MRFMALGLLAFSLLMSASSTGFAHGGHGGHGHGHGHGAAASTAHPHG